MPQEPATAPAPKGLTRRIAALAALLAAVAALADGMTAIANKTTPLICSVGISLPWCATFSPPQPVPPQPLPPSSLPTSPPRQSSLAAPNGMPRINFGGILDSFVISNIRYGKSSEQSSERHRIVFDVKVSSDKVPRSGLSYYSRKVFDKDNLICGTASISITLKYDTWQVGLPGEGELYYGGRNCEASIITFEDAD